MKRLLLGIGLCLSQGCGNYPIAERYVPTDASLTPRVPPGVLPTVPNFVISANTSVDVPYGAFGITTDGSEWYVEWHSTSTGQRFSGEVVCPENCVLSLIHYSSSSPGPIAVLRPYQFKFDAPTQPGTQVRLQFRSTKQPVVFSLQVDGEPATNPKTVLPSNKSHASVDAMPFGLVSSNLTSAQL